MQPPGKLTRRHVRIGSHDGAVWRADTQRPRAKCCERVATARQNASPADLQADCDARGPSTRPGPEAFGAICWVMTQAAPRRRRRTRHGPGPGSASGERLAAGARLFGRYRLQRSIGRGGTAEVWQAHDERLDRTVAIKVLHPHQLPDAPSIERFVAEGRAAAGLAHPGVVPVFDVVEDARTPAIVFRYVDGETLADRIARRGPMPAVEAAAIAADLAAALAHAHHVGLVHRDVKPGNVLVEADGRVQLVDFGIARALEGAEDRETADGLVVGTLRYMAPEQLAGRPIDPRTDLYALGLVLYELLAGHPAFEPASPAALIAAQRTGPPPPPASTPSALETLLAELLAVDRAARPPDADVVEARLRALAGASPTVAASAANATGAARAGARDDRASDADTVAFAAPPTIAIAAPRFAPGPAPVSGAPPSLRPVPRPGPARHRAPIAIGGALAVIGAIVLAILVLAGGPANAPALVTASGPVASAQPGAGQSTAAPAVQQAVKPMRGRGHGKHGDGGN